MQQAFKSHIEDQFPFLLDQPTVVACSGGLDSMVLAHLMHEINPQLTIAHCNFQLRGVESDEDSHFVQEWAESHELPFEVKSFQTESFAQEKGVSIQMAAREIRYQWFEELVQNQKGNWVVTAHHADDNAETFFINLLRGTGINGLCGIPSLQGSIVRPLLSFNKNELLNYARSQGIPWREDSSNSKLDYLRNKLRHQVLPELQHISPQFLNSLETTQHHLNESKDLVEDYMMLVRNLVVTETRNGFEINIQKLSDLPHQGALLFELLRPFGFTAWEDIESLLISQSGKQVFSKTHRLLKDRDTLLLTAHTNAAIPQDVWIKSNTQTITRPIALNFSDAERFEITNAHTVFVDAEKLKFPLLLRPWTEGDVFYPFGMKGKKKLSKFFKDEKLSLVAKENTWILTTENEVVWVVGLRLDDRFKVTKDTKKIKRIDYVPQ